jgi:hypothetical protein
MTEQRARAKPTDQALSGEELAAETATDLPEREAMSTIGHGWGHGVDHIAENFAMPINEATAENVNTTSSVAAADADQTVIIYQVSDK